ncbi:DUF1653 domain-containing protein [Bdellovibrio svalbardensis]|uniref:DUF1653 domain-containing protein n=1 Tax=Bdellovibrio svalbardensis TaxID=2972972 RepID=A0ABT6DJE8_9BACT|nr:DUF1653 domain-containing protein [Bdellovibrio svalbardensis]MDG0816986.1 DUF1653 domain-containing protein [Bdellovibrio svalbardensis]
MNETKPIAGAIYQHYKGKQYRVIGVGRHSETLEEVVLYEALYENSLGRLWSRPLGMWAELVEVNGEMVPRFKFLFN